VDITEFAEHYHVRTQKHEDGEIVIFGKLWKVQPETKFNRQRNPERMDKLRYGHQVFEYGDGRFGVLLMFPVDNGHEIGGSGKSAKWTYAKEKLTVGGITILRDGDAEGIALFDPENKAQARLALKIAGCRVRRQLSPEKRQALAVRLTAARAATKAA
jgi:hypothetical protein